MMRQVSRLINSIIVTSQDHTPHYFNAVNEHQNLHSSSSGVQRLDLGLVQKWTEVFKKADSEALHMGTRDEAMTGGRHQAFILHNGRSVLCEDYQDCGHQLLATHTVAEQRTVKTGFSTTRS